MVKMQRQNHSNSRYIDENQRARVSPLPRSLFQSSVIVQPACVSLTRVNLKHPTSLPHTSHIFQENFSSLPLPPLSFTPHSSLGRRKEKKVAVRFTEIQIIGRIWRPSNVVNFRADGASGLLGTKQCSAQKANGSQAALIFHHGTRSVDIIRHNGDINCTKEGDECLSSFY